MTRKQAAASEPRGRRYEFNYEGWERIELLLPKQAHGGRWVGHRTVPSCLFWVLNSGASWRDMPERYGRWETVYGRFRRWTEEGLNDRILQRRHVSLDEDGRIDRSVFDVDGSSILAHVSAAGGAACSKKTARRARRLRLGTIPRRLWHEASSCSRWPGHPSRGDDLGGPASRVDLLRTAHGHGADLASAASGHGVGRWCRETRATAIRGFGRGCVGEASRASSRRVPIMLRSPSTARRTEAGITPSDASAGSSTAAASRLDTIGWRAAISLSSR
jgi:transposase